MKQLKRFRVFVSEIHNGKEEVHSYDIDAHTRKGAEGKARTRYLRKINSHIATGAVPQLRRLRK
jgi:hypothetical protein